MVSYTYIGLIVLVVGIGLAGVRIIRPIEVGLIERLGKYKQTANQGFHWIIPIIDKMTKVNVTEIRVDIPPQEVITQDKLNAKVDAVVYYRVRDAVKSIYNVNSYERSVVSLARTTLRAVVGKMSLADANEKRDQINQAVETEMSAQIEQPKDDKEGWGIDILRVEIQEITPPEDVQVAMNKVVKAENEKISAVNFANAVETRADGDRRAEIKKAEGVRQARILEAEGQAKAIITVADARAQEIRVVNQSLQKNFKNEAQIHKKLETTQNSLQQGTKYVIDSESNITNVISDLAGVLPIKKNET